jgi:hypothetical protein
MSSVQLPAPVSRCGVMFGATSPGNPKVVKSNPDPSLPATGGRPEIFMSGGAWHEKHAQIPFTRYRPRASRSGVRSNVRSVRGRTLGLLREAGETLLSDCVGSEFCRNWQPFPTASAAARTGNTQNFRHVINVLITSMQRANRAVGRSVPPVAVQSTLEIRRNSLVFSSARQLP